MRPSRAVSMWTSALMATSPTTAAPTQSALTPWAPSHAPANQVFIVKPKYHTLGSSSIVLLHEFVTCPHFSAQASPVGRRTAGVGTGMSAAWGVTRSALTPAPGHRPPPASVSTTRGHTHAGHAALGDRSDGISLLSAPSGAQGVTMSVHQSVNHSSTNLYRALRSQRFV